MKIVVIGAGIVGLASAYFLARAGHEVQIIEKGNKPAQGTSFANAGLIVPSQAPPWNAPGTIFHALRWLCSQTGPLSIEPGLDLQMWAWLARFAWHSRAASYRRNAGRVLALAEFSRHLTREVADRETIDYRPTCRGVLTLVRDPKKVSSLARTARFLSELGIACHLLDRDQCLAKEPALQPIADTLAGALYTPGDGSGDCHAFSEGLILAIRRYGGVLRTSCEVTGFNTVGDKVSCALTTTGAIPGDFFVLASGVNATRSAAMLDLSLHIYPVKGHSVTFDATGWDGRLSLPIRDTQLRVAITPLGDKIRAAGMAILDGGKLSSLPQHLALLRKATRALLPTLPDHCPATNWAGLRPMTPDGPPILGPTKYSNFYLNVGHGALGWTLACGSGALIAASISGEPIDFRLNEFSMKRFYRSSFSSASSRLQG
jgi:D-amino-acid dehydrogenase